jgi:hypothetical protein
MSTFRPNTLVSVFLDEADEDTTDGYGYDVPNADPPGTDADAADWPAYRSDGGQKTTQNGDGSRSVIHMTRFRLRPRAGGPALTEQARIKDQRTGLFYLVDGLPEDNGVVNAADIVVLCRRVT